MTPTDRFNNFYAALQKSNSIWWDLIQVKFSKKDLPDIAQKLLIELYAEGAIVKNMDWKQAQNRFAKMLTWAPDKVEPVPQQKAEPVVIHPQALTGEEREQKIKWYLQEIAKSEAPIAARVNPYAGMTAHLNTKEGQKYRPLSTEEIARRDRHLEYVKYCFDPKTAQPNSKWMPETQFNELYENGDL